MSLDGRAAWLGARSGNGVFVTGPAAANGTGAWIDAGSVVDPSALTGDAYRVEFSVAAGVTTYSVLRNGAATARSTCPTCPARRSSSTAWPSPSTARRPRRPFRRHAVGAGPVAVRRARPLAGELQTRPQHAQVAQTVAAGWATSTPLRQPAAARASRASLNRIDAVEGSWPRPSCRQTERSQAEDLDMVQAISDFQNQQSGYDAALKTYSIVQRMSLFDYL